MRLPLARFRVHDRSMEPTLDEGSYVIVNRWAYRRRTPREGDIVVLRHPREDRYLVKRVQHVEGDRCFVMGDRDQGSVDSRTFGSVARDLIVGKVVFRYG